MQGAWKVGLLVIVFVGLLFGAYAILGRSMFAQQTSTYYADFKDAGGVTPGTSVLLAGVRVGNVSAVRLISPKQARLTLLLQQDVQIPVGSTVVLPSSLIGFGDNPVQIVPPEKLTASFMPPGTVMAGTKLGALEGLFPDAEATMSEVNKTLVAAQGALGAAEDLMKDGELKGSVTKLLTTSEQTVAQFGRIAQRLDTLIVSNQGRLQETLRTAQLAMADVRQSTLMVRELLADDRWKDKAVALLDSLTATTQKAEELMVSINAAVNDPNLREPLAQTLKNTEKITETGTRVAANAEEISKNGIVVSERAIALADKANEIAEEAKTLLQRLQGFFGRTPSTGSIGNIQASLDLMRETRPNHYRMDAEFSLPIGTDSSVHFGIWDAFESNRINLQLGKQYGSNTTLRYGVYASKPGVGVDYRLTPRLFLRGDLFDINNPRGDVRLRYEFGNGFYGWLGMNQVFNRNAPMIGVGFRK